MANAATPAPQTFSPNWMPTGYGYNTVPTRPDYVSTYDPLSMSLSDYYQKNYNPAGMNAFRQEALRKGPSSWATLARQQQNALESNSRERAAKEARSQEAQAMDTLASHGGLTSGARERAALEGSKNYLAMSQDLARQGNLNDLQIGVNDEQNRIQQLGMLPGMDIEQANTFAKAKQADIQNAVAENERRNAYNQNIYNQQMGAWAANRQAIATERSGKK